MTRVNVKDFHPKTGAYWQGWHDAIDGLPKSPPKDYRAQGRQDYAEGYRAGIADLKRLPRQPHEIR